MAEVTSTDDAEPIIATAGEEAGAEGDLHIFQLVFEGVTCDVCGDADQPVNRTCSCGDWAPRDDEHVLSRRGVLSATKAELAKPVSPTTPVELSEAIHPLDGWIEVFFDGLNQIGGGEPDPTLVESQIRRLIAHRARVAAVPLRRPWLALWIPIAAMIDALVLMAAAYLGGATAPDPGGAKAFETIAQRHLDEAAARIATVNSRLDWWGMDTSIRLPGLLVAAASAAYESTGAQNLIDLDRRGMERYEQITGKADGPTGVGVGLLLDLGLADRAFDEDRVYRVAGAVYKRLDAHRAGFVALLDDAGWRADLLNARRVFYEAQLTAETLLRELAGNRRLEAAAVLSLGAKLTERVSSAIVGLVVASDAKERQKRTADYTKFHAGARRLGLGDLLLGFDERIRNADAHTDFDVGDDHVILDRNRRANPQSVSDEDLVDIVLAAVESCASIFAGIDCILIEAGHPAATDRSDDFPIEDSLRILLAASGVQAHQVAINRDRLEVSGTTIGNLSVKPLTVIASLSPSIPEVIRRLTLRVKGANGTVVADVAMEPLRRWRATTGIAKEAAYLEFVGRATLNGRAVMGSKHVRFLAAYYFSPLLHVPLSEAEDAIELLGATARRLKDRELAEAFDAALMMKRAQASGGSVPAIVKTRFERLGTYVAKSPGPWDGGSGSTGGLTIA